METDPNLAELLPNLHCAGCKDHGPFAGEPQCRGIPNYTRPSPPPADDLVEKVDWLLNERELAVKGVELAGPSADEIIRAAARLHKANERAFELLPSIRAALRRNPSPETDRGVEDADLSEHFPTGLRSKRYEIATTHEPIEGPIQCECWCGASFAGTDEQEVRQLWAEHVRALSTPSTPTEAGEETFASINQWCDDTFGPATPQRMIERADEEFTELRAASDDEQRAIEAADVVICLCRIPGFAAALQAKMKVNRKRKWRLTGEGTGYHIPDTGDGA